jgi:ATP-dependent helicase/nuclease subunit B
MPADKARRAGPAPHAGHNVYTVPPGQPFLDALARAVLAGDLPRPGCVRPDPIALPAMTLLLPTRRAARALQEAFLRQSGGAAMLLPAIRPISEGEDDLTLLSGAAGLVTLSAGSEDTPPAVSVLERQLVLTMLVLRWSEALRTRDDDGGMAPFAAAGADSPAQAAAMAAELARLMDMVETEDVRLDGLADLVPETFSEHWQKTLAFLEIVTRYWPVHLAERGMTSPMDRRNRLIHAETRRLVEAPPASPVIIAGVTGSIPATAGLMRAVMELPHGAIVLPGLDRSLDDDGWAAITPDAEGRGGHPEHPQFGLKRLIDRLGLDRRDIAVLPGADPGPRAAQRAAFVSEAMRPSATTARWHDYVSTVDRTALAQALDGVSLIEAPSAQDEAETIALILREVAETPGRTAALVSPDRLLARRVGTRLESFGIRVDDSAGRPFAKTVPGTFLDLVIRAAADDFAPVALMPLLKHPLTRLGLDAFDVRKSARALEIAAFRTAYLGRGLTGVSAALERAAQEEASGDRREAAVRRLWQDDWQSARVLVARLEAAFQPLADAFAHDRPQSLKALARAHLTVAEALAALPPGADGSAPKPHSDGERTSPIWDGEAGRAAAQFFDGLTADAMPAPDVAARDYPDLYRGLLARENVRPRVPVHPRLSIWGPFEARLQQPDVLILGSLNDGTWPEAADPGPWLNRPMRVALGLPSPEERIGLEAHDFTMLLGAHRVYLTRAEKMDGVPTVPSRWLLRIKALLDGTGLAPAISTTTEPWLAWARSRDTIRARQTIAAPAPRPPVADRPRRLSVSGVETWIANPYAVFARHVLRLEPLPRLGDPPDASLRGAIVHEALARFAAAHPTALPDDPAAALLAVARQVLEDYTGHPRIAAFWLTRLERFAHWFAATEAERRAGFASTAAEVQGKIIVPAPGQPFTLTARADRIDIGPGGLRITDYKTGQIPSNDRVESGAAPQLPLEAAIAAAAGFAGVPAAPVTGLCYIRASGGEPPGEQRSVTPKAGNVASLAASQLDGLARLVARYDDPATPYAALRRARFSYDYDAYANLARVGEWSAGDDGGEG